MRAMIIEDFRTGATWTRISHRPEIIRRSDADDSFVGQARNFTPKPESLFIVVVHGDGQTVGGDAPFLRHQRSEEHTSELQSLMRISYAVFCLKKKNTIITNKFLSHDISYFDTHRHQ